MSRLLPSSVQRPLAPVAFLLRSSTSGPLLEQPLLNGFIPPVQTAWSLPSWLAWRPGWRPQESQPSPFTEQSGKGLGAGVLGRDGGPRSWASAISARQAVPASGLPAHHKSIARWGSG